MIRHVLGTEPRRLPHFFLQELQISSICREERSFKFADLQALYSCPRDAIVCAKLTGHRVPDANRATTKRSLLEASPRGGDSPLSRATSTYEESKKNCFNCESRIISLPFRIWSSGGSLVSLVHVYLCLPSFQVADRH